MKLKKQTLESPTRHRLLEALLRRLANSASADQLILRGGMLMRIWFRPELRPAMDLDLTATFPFDIDATGERLVSLLADESVDDGIEFDAKRFRVNGIWMDTEFPGVRMYAAGKVDGQREQFSIDITFGEELVPEPELKPYPCLDGENLQLWMCRPETIMGRKLHAICLSGMMHWRAKDLNDIRLLLEHTTMDDNELANAIAVSFTSRGNTTDDARDLFGPDSWWSTKTASARWFDFVSTWPQELPFEFQDVVSTVKHRLQPILDQMP